jgi:hypothetical protein
MPLQSCAELAAPGVFRPDSAAELEDIKGYPLVRDLVGAR